MYKINDIAHILKYPAVVIVIHLLLTYTGGYYWYGHTDTIMHFLGGASIAAASAEAGHLLERSGKLSMQSRFVRACILIAFTALAAVAWEFFEFTLDHTFGLAMQPSLADTMKDLLAGLLGGSTISLFRVRK
jgi:uncharacterized membrane protein YGL010W